MSTDIKSIVQEKYGEAARRAAQGQTSCGCGSGDGGCGDPITRDLYGDQEKAHLPWKRRSRPPSAAAIRRRWPAAAGRTCWTSVPAAGSTCSSRPGRPGGQGLRPRHDRRMLALARGTSGRPERPTSIPEGKDRMIPFPDNSADVIISNCVINLSADKDAVLREPFGSEARRPVRGLRRRRARPHTRGVRRSVELWVGCLAGALEERSTARSSRTRFLHEGRSGSDPGLQGRGRSRVPRPGGNGSRMAWPRRWTAAS